MRSKTQALPVEALRGLRAKYVEMARLRDLHAAGDTTAPKPAMRALAAQFPGALREIDELPRGEIDRRIAALDGAIDDVARVAPWMIAIARYHGWWRFALRLRSATLEMRTVERARRWCSMQISSAPDEPDPRRLDDALLERLVRPPDGRLHRVITAHLALELEKSEDEIEGWLTTPRPPAREP